MKDFRQLAINEVKNLIDRYAIRPQEVFEIVSIKDRNPFSLKCSYVLPDHEWVRTNKNKYICKVCGKDK